MNQSFDPVARKIDGYEKEMQLTLARMIAEKAISPESGGDGEKKRADWLEKILRRWGFSASRYDYKDKHNAVRSNLIFRQGAGTAKKTVWIVTHIDTVPEGDLSLWSTDPFRGVIKGGRVYGRGTNDNGQEVIASIYAARALKEAGLKQRYSLGIALTADEELGSDYGVKKLLNEGIFKKGDVVLAPDFGNQKGSEIEVSEKSRLWLKVTVKGKQVHASTPQMGKNAYRYMIKYLAEFDRYMHNKYAAKDPMFKTPSTFEMTKHEKNVDSVNIIPGIEVSYIDCRVLPRYTLDRVLADANRLAAKLGTNGVSISIDVFLREDVRRPTSKNAKAVSALQEAVKALRGITPKAIGIGGGTVASLFREKGFDAAVWSTQYDMAHEPNEYAISRFMVEDAKVFAYMCLSTRS